MSADRAAREKTLRGETVASGIGIGYAVLEEVLKKVPSYRIEDAMIAVEQERFHAALRDVRRNLAHHIRTAHGSATDEFAQILRAHEMMLDDQVVIGRVERRIAGNRKNAEWAVREELESLVAEFEHMRDSYLQARAEDVRDLGLNILEALAAGRSGGSDGEAEGAVGGGQALPAVMVTHNLYPSLAMQAHERNVVGFATESCALTSHAAILLKGLGIPVIGAVSGLSEALSKGDRVLVDGVNGLVVVSPSKRSLERYERLRRRLNEPPARAAVPEIAVSRDGIRIELLANIEPPSQVSLVLHKRLAGVGLFRTEFMALKEGTVPDEEEQYGTYRRVVEQLEGKPLVVRTLDIGADKSTAGLHRCVGANPALGLRGIRRHLVNTPEELRSQMRAVLRAAVDAPVGILFPMVTDVRDIRLAKEHLASVEHGLRLAGIRFNESVRVGAMLEVPSAAILVSEILREVDFISVGTNDLLQYFTAADRDNPEVSRYYDPQSASFRRLLEFVAREARAAGREGDVTICGEIAANPTMIPALLAMGFRSFSIAPVGAEDVRAALSGISIGRRDGRDGKDSTL